MYYTIEEVMDLLRISRNTAYRLAHKNGVPTIKIGKKILFDKELFHRWLREHMNKNLLAEESTHLFTHS